MTIEIWTSKGKKSVLISDCLAVTTKDSDFYAICAGGLNGEINLDSINIIFEQLQTIIDEKALELRETREKVRGLLRDKH